MTAVGWIGVWLLAAAVALIVMELGWLGFRLLRLRRQVLAVELVLAREEAHGDVHGFLHTHPVGSPAPSQRDLRTMRAWTAAFGKPLLCLITARRGTAGRSSRPSG